jgi:hypothetical protein
MAGQLGHHSSRGALLAAGPWLPRLPAVIVKGGEHGEGRLKVRQLLGEAVGIPTIDYSKSSPRAIQLRFAAFQKCRSVNQT